MGGRRDPPLRHLVIFNFTLCSFADNFIIVFINQIAYKHKLKSCGCKPPLCKGRCHFLKMTEGLLYTQINMLANTPKILFDFIIRYSNYFKSVLLKKFCAFNILFNATIFIMLWTIKFNYQFCFGTVKINNIFTYNLLPIKSYRICPQKNHTINGVLRVSYFCVIFFQH